MVAGGGGVCMVLFGGGGHAWFYSAGEGCAWFYSVGGMRGFIPGGWRAWFYSAGGCAWFYSAGGCVWFYSVGGVHGFIRGGMHGFIQQGGVCGFIQRGACMVLFRGGVRGFFSFSGYNEIRSMSGRYASYWNAFLYLVAMTDCPHLVRDVVFSVSRVYLWTCCTGFYRDPERRVHVGRDPASL